MYNDFIQSDKNKLTIFFLENFESIAVFYLSLKVIFVYILSSIFRGVHFEGDVFLIDPDL